MVAVVLLDLGGRCANGDVSGDIGRRFKNNAFDLVIEGESYRPRLKPSIDNAPPPAAPVVKWQHPGRRRPLRVAR